MSDPGNSWSYLSVISFTIFSKQIFNHLRADGPFREGLLQPRMQLLAGEHLPPPIPFTTMSSSRSTSS